jgi:hypothetical protein
MREREKIKLNDWSPRRGKEKKKSSNYDENDKEPCE